MKKKCILIYDDDPDMLLVCKLILEDKNYHVETRANCEKVIEDIKKLGPSLVLMDLRIPGMGGERAVQLINNTPETKQIPVLIFSANAEVEEIYKRIHAKGFLKKPFEINSLFQIVESHILME